MPSPPGPFYPVFPAAPFLLPCLTPLQTTHFKDLRTTVKELDNVLQNGPARPGRLNDPSFPATASFLPPCRVAIVTDLFRPCFAAPPWPLPPVAPFLRDVCHAIDPRKHFRVLKSKSFFVWLIFCDPAFASVQSDIFKPTKYGGKYTVTLIPGMFDQRLSFSFS